MSTNSDDERSGDTEADEDVRDDAALAWPEPLSSEERSRSDERTWNWDAVKIYPGGNGPGVPFSTYARESEPHRAPSAAADHGAVDSEGADALDNTPPEA